jgi:putative hemolysin
MSEKNQFSTQLVSSSRYMVCLAETEDAIRQAQSIRYQVFNLELGEGLDESHQNSLDVDQYDFQCDHLLVVEQESEKVIGTYRMQTYQKAREYKGFYTADEFSLLDLPDGLLNESVEVGRACIHKEHRNGRVLYLLWKGIAEYMKMTESRYLFGCCSITSTDPREGWIVMDYLKETGHLHESFKLSTNPKYKCPETEREKNAWKEVKLPQLFNLYLDLGAKILSDPALDKEFKTIDFLILVDITQLDERSKKLFLK